MTARLFALLALASALVAAATLLYATHRRHWAEMTCEDYVTLLESDEGLESCA